MDVESSFVVFLRCFFDALLGGVRDGEFVSSSVADDVGKAESCLVFFCLRRSLRDVGIVIAITLSLSSLASGVDI